MESERNWICEIWMADQGNMCSPFACVRMSDARQNYNNDAFQKIVSHICEWHDENESLGTRNDARIRYQIVYLFIFMSKVLIECIIIFHCHAVSRRLLRLESRPRAPNISTVAQWKITQNICVSCIYMSIVDNDNYNNDKLISILQN